MTEPTVVATAASLALVLSFAALRASDLRRLLPLLRWHALACAAALLAAALRAAPHAAAARVAASLVLTLLAWQADGLVRRLDRRTGVVGPRRGASLPPVVMGLALTGLAVVTVAASPPSVAGTREVLALALAVTLIGLAEAARPGPPALCAVRIALLGNGLGLLGCAGPVACAWGVLLGPACLLTASVTIGRAGGLPTRQERDGGWT